MDRVIRLPELIELTGLSTATVYRLVAQGQFPRPIRLTKSTVGWRASEVEAWIESREYVDVAPGREVGGGR
jgi:prophage regulatory protein